MVVKVKNSNLQMGLNLFPAFRGGEVTFIWGQLMRCFHQVLGALKPGDIPAEVRVKAIDALVNNYFVHGTIVQAGYPIEMRYAGPREALLHAVLRQNFGCSHQIVGRDHAGVGDYYGPFDAHHIFDTLEEGSLRTEPLKIDITFYCYTCGGMATGKTCPHDASDRLAISGTRLREMFANGEEIPPEFSRREVVDSDHWQRRNRFLSLCRPHLFDDFVERHRVIVAEPL